MNPATGRGAQLAPARRRASLRHAPAPFSRPCRPARLAAALLLAALACLSATPASAVDLWAAHVGTDDGTAPRIVSIERYQAPEHTRNRDHNFLVTFSEPVANLDTGDFDAHGAADEWWRVWGVEATRAERGSAERREFLKSCNMDGDLINEHLRDAGARLALRSDLRRECERRKRMWRQYVVEVGSREIRDGRVRTVSLHLMAGQDVQDAWGNRLDATLPTGGNYETFLVDRQRPRPVVVTGTGCCGSSAYTKVEYHDGPGGFNLFWIWIDFGEPVNGLYSHEIRIIGGDANGGWGFRHYDGDTRYQLLIGATGTDDIEITVPQGAAEDLAGNGTLASETLIVPYRVAALRLATPPDRTFTAGHPLSGVTLPAAGGGSGSYSYALTGRGGAGRPSWLGFDPATRMISGTPPATAAGTATTLDYTVSDGSASVTRSFTVTVNAALSLTAPSNQTYTVGTAITAFTLSPATGGTAPLRYELSGLPGGLAFSGSTRRLAGTPRVATATPATVTYRVTDKNGATDTDTFTITVEAAVPTDTTAPRVTSIERQSPSDQDTNANSLTFRVTFSEAVQNVNAADFDPTGTSANATTVTGSGTQYAVTVSAGNLAGYDGTVGLGFATNQNIADAAGNALSNTTPTGVNQTYTLDNTAPTVTLTAPGSHDGSTAFDVSVVFSEDVTDFDDAADVTVTGGSASIASTDARNYTVSITPTGTGNVTVQVPVNAASDDAGNGNAASATSTVNYVAVDNTAPTITSIERQSPSDQNTNANSLTFLVTFSEDVDNVNAADFDPTGTNAPASDVQARNDMDSADATQPASVFRVTVSGGNLNGYNGTVGLGLASGQNIQDDADNALSTTLPAGTNNETYTLDNRAPTVTLNAPANHDGSTAFDVTVTFSEDVTGFSAATDVTVTGGTGSITSTNARTYTARITPTVTGNVTVRVPINAATDTAGNGNAASTTSTVTYVAVDSTAPRVSRIERQTPPGEDTNANSLTFLVTFSEAVDNVDTTDFDPTGTTAPASNVQARNAADTADATQPARVFRVTVSGGNLNNYNGTVGLGLATGQNIQDEADNALSTTLPTGTNNETYTLDNTAPTATLAPPANHDGSTAFDVTVTFSEDVTGFSATSDVTVTGGTASITSTNARTYTASITPSGTGNVTVQVPINAAEDAAGNGNAASATSTVTYAAVDSTAPTITSIERQSPSDQNTNADSLIFLVTFSEDVDNVNAADFDPTGTTAPASGVQARNAADTVNATQPASVFRVTVSGVNLNNYNGTVGLGLATGQNIQDEADNDLSTTLPTGMNNETYTVDNTAPTATLTPPASHDGTAFNVGVEFSEDVSDFDDAADVTVTGGSLTGGASGISRTDARNYTLSITPTGTGSVTVRVAANAAEDAAGNGNAASATSTVTYTAPPPADTTLSALTLTAAGEAVALSPAFASGTRAYTAAVRSDVASVTVAATATATGATVAFTPADADTSTAGHQVSLTEGANAITATVTNGGSTGGSYTVTVTRVEPATLSVGNDTAYEGGTFDFPVTVDNAVPGGFTVTVSFSARGWSASFADQTLIFDGNAGESKTASITVADDALPQSRARLIDVQIEASRDAIDDSATGTGRLLDNDSGVISMANATAAEGEDLTFTVSFTAGIVAGGFTVTLSYTDAATDGATSGTDYTPYNQTLSFNGLGSQSRSFTVAALADTVDENDETFTVTATPSVTGVPAVSATGTITNVAPADTAAPTVSRIERQSPSDQNTNANSLTFRVTFSEDVENVNAADFTVTAPGGGTATTATVSGVQARNDGDTANATEPASVFRVTVSGGNLNNYNGTVGLGLATGQNIQDEADNDLSTTLPTGTNYETYTLDNTPPAVSKIERHDGTSAQGQTTNADSVTFRVTFSETVENVGTADFTVTAPGGGTATTATATNVTGSGTQYVVTVSTGNLTGYNGTVGLGLATGQNIQDEADNALSTTLPTGMNNETYTVDNTAPTATLTPPASHDGTAFSVAVEFSEGVSDFDDAADVTVTGGSLTGGASGITSTDADSYTVSITPMGTGSVTVRVAANAATDDAGNGNALSGTKTVGYTAPPPADTTLSALTLTTAAGATVALSPAFASATTAYTAAVRSDVASVTVAATATAMGATVAFTPADADTVTDGHQVSLTEGANAITATVTNGGSTGGSYTVTVTRVAAATLTVGNDTVVEGGTFEFPVSVDNAVPGGFTVTVSFSHLGPSPATYPSQTLIFEGDAGESHTATAATTDDALPQSGARFVNVSLEASLDAIDDSDKGRGTLVDNDSGIISMANATAAEGEDLTFTVRFTAGRVAGGFTVTLTYGGSATSGTDYTPYTGTLTFVGPGTPEEHSFTVAALADSVDEGNETFTVTATPSKPGVPAVTATGTITNVAPADSTAPTVSRIERQSPSGQDTNADSLTFLVTFSEDVENVGTADFAAAAPGGGTATTATVTGVQARNDGDTADATEPASVFRVTVSSGKPGELQRHGGPRLRHREPGHHGRSGQRPHRHPAHGYELRDLHPRQHRAGGEQDRAPRRHQRAGSGHQRGHAGVPRDVQRDGRERGHGGLRGHRARRRHGHHGHRHQRKRQRHAVRGHRKQRQPGELQRRGGSGTGHRPGHRGRGGQRPRHHPAHGDEQRGLHRRQHRPGGGPGARRRRGHDALRRVRRHGDVHRGQRPRHHRRGRLRRGRPGGGQRRGHGGRHVGPAGVDGDGDADVRLLGRRDGEPAGGPGAGRRRQRQYRGPNAHGSDRRRRAGGGLDRAPGARRRAHERRQADVPGDVQRGRRERGAG